MSLSCWTALGQSYYSCLPWAWSEMKNHNYCWLNWNLFFSTSPINRNNVTRESESESCIFNKCADFSTLKTKKKSNHVEMLLVGKPVCLRTFSTILNRLNATFFDERAFFSLGIFFFLRFSFNASMYITLIKCVYINSLRLAHSAFIFILEIASVSFHSLRRREW